MAERNKEYLNKVSKISNKEIMKDVFRPLSPKVQELISVGGKLQGKDISAESARNATSVMPTPSSPEWGLRYGGEIPNTEKYIPTSPLEKEANVTGAKTPRASQYLDAIKKMQEIGSKSKSVDMQEKFHYEALPDAPSMDKEALKNPRVKQFLDKEYSRYKELKSILEENFNLINPNTREKIKDELRILEGGLVISGKLQKA